MTSLSRKEIFCIIKFVILNIIRLTVNGWRVIFGNTNHEVVGWLFWFTSFDISLDTIHFSSAVINLSKNESTLWQLTGDEQILTGQRNSSLTIRVKRAAGHVTRLKQIRTCFVAFHRFYVMIRVNWFPVREDKAVNISTVIHSVSFFRSSHCFSGILSRSVTKYFSNFLSV